VTVVERPVVRVLRGLAPAVALVLLAGCSVGVQDRPVVLGRPSTASAVLDGTVQTSTSVQTFFVRGDRLVPLVRLAPLGPGLQPCLSGLVLPLTAKESASGLRSALPTGVARMTATVDGSVADVDVPAGLDRLTVSDQILAVAQIVYTITANSYVTTVELVQHGRALPMPDQSGQLVSRPLSRADYSTLAAA
jgi:hypothetical protein